MAKSNHPERKNEEAKNRRITALSRFVQIIEPPLRLTFKRLTGLSEALYSGEEKKKEKQN